MHFTNPSFEIAAYVGLNITSNPVHLYFKMLAAPAFKGPAPFRGEPV